MRNLLVRGLRDGLVVHALEGRVNVDIRRLDDSSVGWSNRFSHSNQQAKKDLYMSNPTSGSDVGDVVMPDGTSRADDTRGQRTGGD